MVTEKILRHQPTQKRSRDRVAYILHAAELVFQRVGYDAATTNAIAEEAKIPIGSLYQYFRNKKSILITLTEKYSGELRAIFKEHFSFPVTKESIYQLADRLIEQICNFYLNHPAFRVVFYGSGRSDDLGQTSDALLEEIIKHVYYALSMVMPVSDTQKIGIIATVIVRSVRSSIPHAINKDGTVNDVMMDEIRKMTNAYLKASIEPSQPPV
jgi:AcrR family transcriptional regulator